MFDIPAEPPLEPKQLCEDCGIFWAVEEIAYGSESGARVYTSLCQECAQGYWESIEPTDSHYYPRS